MFHELWLFGEFRTVMGGSLHTVLAFRHIYFTVLLQSCSYSFRTTMETLRLQFIYCAVTTTRCPPILTK